MYELFILKTCPYCKKVLEYLKSTKIDYGIRDIADKQTLERLLNIGGKNQVPFLYNKEKNIKMYESNDIINFLKTLKV